LDFDVLKKILDNLISLETDPVQKNIALAKKDAVIAIAEGYSPHVLIKRLCAYFDKDIEKELMII